MAQIKTRDRIIRSALNFIGKEGVQKMTFARVGAPIKINASQVRYHFRTLDELIVTAFEELFENMADEVLPRFEAASGPKKKKLEALADGLFHWAEKNPNKMKALLLFYYESSHRPKLAKLHRQLGSLGVKRLINILSDGSKHSKSMERAVEAKAWLIWAALEGLLLYHATMASIPSSWRPRELFKIAIQGLS